MDEGIQRTNELIRHLQKTSGVASTSEWILSSSPIGGRGLFATRDLLAGDLVFVDAPLVVGPRVVDKSAPMCVGCHRTSATLVACSRGCGLPVCDVACETAERHREECVRLVTWRPVKKETGTWSPGLLKALTPIRCLSLDDEQRSLVRCLEAHRGPLHEREITLLKENVDTGLNPAEEKFLRFCCCALDANSFEINIHSSQSVDDDSALCQSRLRGLYPLAAMLNHSCTSNTRHGFDKDLRMFVTATVAIPQGTEITTSYFALLWGTTARRHHLSKTKHFLCFCGRCKDPQEGGTLLSALKCPARPCPGNLLSEDPVKAGSKWSCDHCGLRIPEKETRLIQSGLGTMLRAVNCDDPVHVSAFLRGHKRLFATSNQVIVELKSCLVWILGHFPGYQWQELSDAYLDVKVSYCKELLAILDLLKAGQCRLRGLFLYELHCTIAEQHRRNPNKTQLMADEAVTCIEEAAAMFLQDVTAPSDLWRRLSAAKLTPNP